MKQLVVMIGPNGVGKSTVAQNLVRQCGKSAYVDSDWCRAMNPFEFTEITKLTVAENIYCLLRNYLTCEDIDIVVFTYGWHGDRKNIYENVMDRLRNDGIEFDENIFILKCSMSENIKRATQDGRDATRIERGIEKTFSFYDDYNYPCIDTTEMNPSQVAKRIITMINHKFDE